MADDYQTSKSNDYQYSEIGTRWNSKWNCTTRPSFTGKNFYRPRTPRAVEDQPGRGSSDVSAKRRSTEARGSNEPIAIIEELRAQCQSLREKVTQSEMYAASRDQLINDIEMKFSDYLRGHNQQVFNEISALNNRLMYSSNKVTEYQAELMLASKEDEGASIRIEDLERRGALAEHGARRIYECGLEIQEEYKDEVCNRCNRCSMMVALLGVLLKHYTKKAMKCKETLRMP
jgi:hypothetical protein